MKILITSPINPITSSPYSHRSAQAEMYGQMFRNKGHDVVLNYGNKIKNYEDYDFIYVYHGNDWGGTLNLFGGPDGISDKEGLVKLFKMNSMQVISLAIPMPDYPYLLRKRLRDGQKFGNILDELPESISDTHYLVTDPSFEKSDSLIVGDSHAICMYRPAWNVLSIPFKTLHGALSIGLDRIISDNFDKKFNHLGFYFGNIDIRHHLCRRDNPLEATRDLANRYVNQCIELLDTYKTVEIYEPLPIENESRKLPKSGYYKGQPFYGSWEERNAVRNQFIHELSKRCNDSVIGLTFTRWTDYLKNEKGELDFAHMEKPRSVHLARASYPYWTGIENKKENTLEEFFN